MKSRDVGNPVPTVFAKVGGHHPTDEQNAILDAVRGGPPKVLVIAAGAGTGKTSTLKMLEEIMRGRGQYTAFNSLLVTESKRKFRRAACNTTHSLAFREVGRRYAHRLGAQRVRSEEVARIMGLESMSVAMPNDADPNGEPKVKTLSPGHLASVVMAAVRKFCQSDDAEVDRHHFKRIDGIDVVGEDGEVDRSNSRMVTDALVPFARAAWADKAKVDGRLPFTHDDYVKVWQLGRGSESPVISTYSSVSRLRSSWLVTITNASTSGVARSTRWRRSPERRDGC